MPIAISTCSTGGRKYYAAVRESVVALHKRFESMGPTRSKPALELDNNDAITTSDSLMNAELLARSEQPDASIAHFQLLESQLAQFMKKYTR